MTGFVYFKVVEMYYVTCLYYGLGFVVYLAFAFDAVHNLSFLIEFPPGSD